MYNEVDNKTIALPSLPFSADIKKLSHCDPPLVGKEALGSSQKSPIKEITLDASYSQLIEKLLTSIRGKCPAVLYNMLQRLSDLGRVDVSPLAFQHGEFEGRERFKNGHVVWLV
jgi:hypothetical protein